MLPPYFRPWRTCTEIPCHVWTAATTSKVRFCTCPVAQARTFRNTIIGSGIVEMGPYHSCVSVALGIHNFVARASQTWSVIRMTWRMVVWAVAAQKRNRPWSSDSRWIKVERFQWCGDTPLVLELQSFESWQDLGNVITGFKFRSLYLLVRLCYCDRTCIKMKPFPCTLWWSANCWSNPIQMQLWRLWKM